MGAGIEQDHDRAEREAPEARPEPVHDIEPPAGEPEAPARQLQEANRRLQRANERLRKAVERARDTERALHESHADLERAQSVARIGSWRLDIQRDVLRWSDESYRIFGVPPGTSLTYEAFLECVHPDDRAYVHREWTAALRGEPYDIEHRLLLAGGEIKWVREKADLEFDERGALLGGIGITQDITERKHVEDQLRQSQERFELALRGADLAAWDWNIRTGEVVFNARWAEMRGFRPEELAPHESTWASFVHPDDWPLVQKALNDYFQGVAPEYKVEHRVRTRSGEHIWILDRGKLFARDEQGRPARMVGTERDITERRRHDDAQRLLAEVGALFASSLEYEETLSNIVRLVVRDLADYCVVDVLEQGELRRLRVESRDPSNARVCDLLARLSLDPRRPHLLRSVLETGRPFLVGRLSPGDVESLSQSEEHLRALRAMDPRSVIAVPLLAHGKLLGGMALVSSASSHVYGPPDLHLAEEIGLRAALSIENALLFQAAGRALQARDDVLGVVAHDLRNPLGAIRMQAAHLQRLAPAADPRLRKAVVAIERAAARMNRLIQDLLDVARVEAGRLSVERTRVAAAPLVSDSVECQRALASAASIELRADVPEELPEVWADRDRLLQVFENLVGNALAFTGAGGSVTVGVAPRDGDVQFWVADTGCGIAAEDLPHVFDRFWQARRPGRRGAGLGLAIVKGIVEAHGGRVWVESAPGRGSTFRFTIPAAPRASHARAEPAPHNL